MKKKEESLQISLEQNTSSEMTLVTSDAMETKIRRLCALFPENEWSGVLFYKVEGTFGKDMVFTCLDFELMGIGSKGYTEYDDNPDIIQYRVDHELLGPDVYEGHIHSHNSMPTFFSGEDTSTLNECGKQMNHFLSLIVNNAGIYSARVTYRVKGSIERTCHIESKYMLHYNTFDDRKTDIKARTTKETKQDKVPVDSVMWHDLKITRGNCAEDFDELCSRVLSLVKSSTQPKYQYDYSKAYNSLSPSYQMSLDFKPAKKKKHADIKTSSCEEMFVDRVVSGSLFGYGEPSDADWEKLRNKYKNEESFLSFIENLMLALDVDDMLGDAEGIENTIKAVKRRGRTPIATDMLLILDDMLSVYRDDGFDDEENDLFEGNEQLMLD